MLEWSVKRGIDSLFSIVNDTISVLSQHDEPKRGREKMKWHFGLVAGVAAAILAAGAHDAAADQCVPGKTGRIAFMLKQQTAFRYLNADVPFFKKTAEAAGYQVLVQSAENDANNQVAQAENVITKGVDAF